MPIIGVIIAILLLAVLVGLEMSFARRETISLGILLPGFLMIAAVVVTCWVGAHSRLSDIDFMIQMLTVFLLANIPAYLLLLVFCVVRKQYLNQKPADRMKSKDPE